MQQFQQADKSPEPTQTTIAQSITALGRLKPEQEVIKVSVPATLNNDRIAQLLVQRGDRVKTRSSDGSDGVARSPTKSFFGSTGTDQRCPIETGADTSRSQSGRNATQQAQVTRFQSELRGEIATRQAEITRRRLEVKNAQAEYDRTYMG
uniref:ABC exporter membrane fusion protein n=1 Tax=Nostoc flagelliforme str. Sunitezuoqi TaxID=676037 RepID=E7DPK1_9NOSO|nr:ABC exporter membrane fusion protein [Nostoc flagelliforme str. Sunitezuoqi]